MIILAVTLIVLLIIVAIFTLDFSHDLRIGDEVEVRPIMAWYKGRVICIKDGEVTVLYYIGKEAKHFRFIDTDQHPWYLDKQVRVPK